MISVFEIPVINTLTVPIVNTKSQLTPLENLSQFNRSIPGKNMAVNPSTAIIVVLIDLIHPLANQNAITVRTMNSVLLSFTENGSTGLELRMLSFSMLFGGYIRIRKAKNKSTAMNPMGKPIMHHCPNVI